MHRTHSLLARQPDAKFALHPDVPAIRGLTANSLRRLGLHKLTVSAATLGLSSASQSGRKEQRLRRVVIMVAVCMDAVLRDDPSLATSGEMAFVRAAEGSREVMERVGGMSPVPARRFVLECVRASSARLVLEWATGALADEQANYPVRRGPE